MNERDLHEYQLTAINHIIDNTHSALFLEMGLGKTISALTAIKKLMFEDFDISNALIIAPKRVAESVWSTEIKKWEHVKFLKISKIIGSLKQRRAALMEKADLYIIGRDNIAWLCNQYGGLKLPFDMLVIDELSSFKNHKSVRFKALRKTQPFFKRVVGLTGTPAPNGLIDLWSQIYLLDGGKRLGKFITNYRDNFFALNPHCPFKYHLKEGASDTIHNRLKDICISMKTKDYIKLPGRVDNIIQLNFQDELQREYDKFEKEQVLSLFADKEETEITAVNAAALSNKLLQFANGAVYDKNKNYYVVHNLKIEAVKEIIEDANGKPVLIAWTYRHDLYRLKENLKKHKPRELKTDKDISDWNKGEIQVMLMHPASGGHGLNLQSGGHIIVWFGQTWSLELEQQFNARVLRQGQKNIVIVNKLVASKTIDQDVIKAMKNKEAGQEALMQAVKSRIKKYVF